MQNMESNDITLPVHSSSEPARNADFHIIEAKAEIQAPASYAQVRIWHDLEKPQVTVNNMPFIYRLSTGGTLSITQLQRTMQLFVTRHQSLRTALLFDAEKDILIQQIKDLSKDDDQGNNLFVFIESTFETDEELNSIINDEQNNPTHFDLSRGLVFRCHIVYYKQISQDNILSEDDVLIFNFHPAVFDIASMEVFLRSLVKAYTTGKLSTDDNSMALQYIDYAVAERKMTMDTASAFWFESLKDYDINRPLQLPFDRRRVANCHLTGCNTSACFDFGESLSQAFLTYASTTNTLPMHLALACYFVFLFKLTNGEQDLCIGVNMSSRHTAEFSSLIGLFVNTLPLRCQIDPRCSFNQLVEQVRVMATHSSEYSYFPLERILAQHLAATSPAFLETGFAFWSTLIEYNFNKVKLGDVTIYAIPNTIKMVKDDIVSRFDFSLTVQHNPIMGQLSCIINASIDLFDKITVSKIAQRFHFMLEQIFFTCNHARQPICELSLILPEEATLIQLLTDTKISFPPAYCVQYEFAQRMNEQPQKVAVELDEQCLTYSELCYNAQRLTLYLLKEHGIKPGEIICQCIERGLSMVIGIISIQMAGAAYCALSPRDPQQRLHALLKDAQNRLVLVNWRTQNIFNDNHVTLDVDKTITNYDMFLDVGLDQFLRIKLTPENIAYVVFTSGSTGTPKACQLRHRNLTGCIRSLVHIGTFSRKDNVVQMSHCSFDMHLHDIVGTLITGATLVMLRPKGNMDFEYLAGLLNEKQITCILTVPAVLYSLFNFVNENNHISTNRSLRSLCSGGEALSVKLVSLLKKHVSVTCRIWNLYGPSEITFACTHHVVDLMVDIISIPIGRSLPNYQCRILDEFFQPVTVGQEGELFVGGEGVFVGYLDRRDLAAKILLEIENQMFYRTGDFVRLDSSGNLHYLRRKDHLVKLRGQRIEMAEIEQCLLHSSPEVYSCSRAQFYIFENMDSPLQSIAIFLPEYNL